MPVKCVLFLPQNAPRSIIRLGREGTENKNKGTELLLSWRAVVSAISAFLTLEHIVLIYHISILAYCTVCVS